MKNLIHARHTAAFDQTRRSLIETAEAKARLIEAVARFDHAHSGRKPFLFGSSRTMLFLAKCYENQIGVIPAG